METETLHQFHDKVELAETKALGNFNIFSIDDLSSCSVQPIPFWRTFYKISLLKGKYMVHYADKTYTIQKQALLFANPTLPYNWIPKEGKHSGIYCIFSPEFFHSFGDITDYSVFQREGTHVIELTDKEFIEAEQSFVKMQREMLTDYSHKFDLIRNLIYEVLHFATRISPTNNQFKKHNDAYKRITDSFLEILENQFSIASFDEKPKLNSPGDFADKMNIHVNYLNRVLKNTMGSATSELIQQRKLQEAKVLLKHSVLNISQISLLLGFKKTTHFSNFFKKMENISPFAYRKV